MPWWLDTERLAKNSGARGVCHLYALVRYLDGRRARTCPNTAEMLCRVLCIRAVRSAYDSCDPNGIRTRVTAVKGRCPGPLDDRVIRQLPDGQYRNCSCFTQGKLRRVFGVRRHVGAFKARYRTSPSDWRTRTCQRTPSRESARLRARLHLDARSKLHARFGQGACALRCRQEARRVFVQVN